MARTIQDVIREQDNAKREAAGKQADAAAASKINPGGLAEAAAAAAAKRKAAAAATTMPKVVRPSPAPSVKPPKPNAQRDY